MRFQMSSMARMSPFDGTLETRIPEETSEYSTELRATERVSRELTTALGIPAACATVDVLD